MFDRYGFGWMTEPSGSYSPELVREFYDSYVASIELITLVEQRFWDQPPLTHTLVCGTKVDISEQTIHQFLFGAERQLPASTTEFDHRMETVKNRNKIKDANQRLDLLRWVAQYITKDGINVKWVVEKLDIKKSLLHFTGRF